MHGFLLLLDKTHELQIIGGLRCTKDDEVAGDGWHRREERAPSLYFIFNTLVSIKDSIFFFYSFVSLMLLFNSFR